MNLNTLIVKTSEIFEKNHYEYEERINEAKIGREKAEHKKRFQLEQDRVERYKSIIEENQKTVISMAELEMKFGYYSQIENSEKLSEYLESYKNEFGVLLTKKDDFINRLKLSLEEYEDKYLIGMNIFHEEFERVVQEGRSHFLKSRLLAESLLIELEESLMTERNKGIKANKTEIRMLLKNHEKAEAGFVQHKESEESRCFKELTLLRQEKSREYSDLKFQLETEIQNHEKCLEDMKAIYQLNTKKHKKNFKVHTKKKKENTALAMEKKKKERYFLNLLKRKNDDFSLKDSEFRKENNRLTDISKTITKKYRDMHKKFEHFEKTDIEKYQQVFEVSISEIDRLKEKIINTHHILSNQQLGLTLLPTESIEEINSAVLDNLDDRVSVRASDSGLMVKSNSFKMSEKELRGVTNDDRMQCNQISISSEDKRQLVNIIFKETEYLLDDKIISEIETYDDEQEKLLRRLDLLVKVLNLRGLREADEWIFKMHASCSTDNNNYDIDVINENLIKLIDMTVNTTNNNTNDKLLAQEDSSADHSKSNETIQEEKYWENIGKVLDSNTLELWAVMEKFSCRYHNVLLQRRNYILENKEIRKKNDEMLKILDEHRNTDTKLIFSPNHILDDL